MRSVRAKLANLRSHMVILEGTRAALRNQQISAITLMAGTAWMALSTAAGFARRPCNAQQGFRGSWGSIDLLAVGMPQLLPQRRERDEERHGGHRDRHARKIGRHRVEPAHTGRERDSATAADQAVAWKIQGERQG